MATMLYAGLRCAEALALRPRDVDFSRYLLIVVAGKGKKDRVVPISTALEPLLLEWRGKRPPSSRFFSTLNGGELGARYVRRMVKRYAEKAGIDEDVHSASLAAHVRDGLAERGAEAERPRSPGAPRA
jgi:integrase/recombinase XerD